MQDPVNLFNNAISSNWLDNLNDAAWYETNGIPVKLGDMTWRESVDSSSRRFTEAYRYVATHGRMTPEIEARYREAMGQLAAHEKDIRAGVEPPVPSRFTRMLRLDGPTTNDGIRNRVLEYLASPILDARTGKRAADLAVDKLMWRA